MPFPEVLLIHIEECSNWYNVAQILISDLGYLSTKATLI